MKRSVVIFAWASFVAFSCVGSAQESTLLEINTSQSLMVFSRELEEKYGWLINFEDAPVEGPKYTVTTTDKFGRPLVLPKPSRIAVQVSPLDRLDDRGRRKLLQSVIDQANAAGGPVHYAYSINGDFVRIFPKEVLSDEDGTWQSYTPLLDTTVSIPKGRYQIWRVMSLVLAEVERQRGVRISIGTVSPNLAAQEVTEGAINEPAGLILDRAFDSVNAPRLREGLGRLVFRSALNYWTDDQTFFYNMVVAKVLDPPKRQEEQEPAMVHPTTSCRFGRCPPL